MGIFNFLARLFDTLEKPRLDVHGRLRELAAANSEKLNWQSSIVDLLKLIGKDSSLSARRQLAKDYGYNGSLDGSAGMNIWLHGQVMSKIESGEIRT